MTASENGGLIIGAMQIVKDSGMKTQSHWPTVDKRPGSWSSAKTHLDFGRDRYHIFVVVSTLEEFRGNRQMTDWRGLSVQFHISAFIECLRGPCLWGCVDFLTVSGHRNGAKAIYCTSTQSGFWLKVPSVSVSQCAWKYPFLIEHCVSLPGSFPTRKSRQPYRRSTLLCITWGSILVSQEPRSRMCQHLHYYGWIIVARITSDSYERSNLQRCLEKA